MRELWAAIKTDVLVQVLATVLAAFLIWLAIRLYHGCRTVIAGWRDKRKRKAALRLTGDLNSMADGIGMSTDVQLTYRTDATGPTVEVETPDGLRVWPVKLYPGLIAWDLALAARSHFDLKDQYYRLHHKPSARDLDRRVEVRSAVSEGDRLALVPHGAFAWGWEPRRRFAFRVVAWFGSFRRNADAGSRKGREYSPTDCEG